MVGFAVVGLGMGRGRARLVKETAGAELVAVVDLKNRPEVAELLLLDINTNKHYGTLCKNIRYIKSAYSINLR